MKCEVNETIFIASLVIFLLGQATAQFLEPECGALRISKRMVNGTDAEKGKYPWMAFIHRGKHLVCGGTLINQWFVLSAAHCFTKKPQGLAVSLGVYDRSDLDPSRLYQVERFFKHSSFVGSFKDSDIALLKLARKVELSAHIRPICILTDPILKADRVPWFLTLGWGRTKPDGKQSPVLQEKIIKRTDKSECGCLDSQICTMAENGTICYGDSGGPLVRVLRSRHGRRYIQLGIASYYVKGKCRKHAVYTDVLSHTSWIQSVVAQHTPNDGWNRGLTYGTGYIVI